MQCKDNLFFHKSLKALTDCLLTWSESLGEFLSISYLLKQIKNKLGQS